MLSDEASVGRIIFILFLGFVLWITVHFLTPTIIRSLSPKEIKSKRMTTLSHLLRGTVSTVIVVLAFFMILREIGFDITPLVASAGIVGLAVGFGAQTLVKDVITGVFLLIEDQFNEGDEVEIAGKKGLVEKVSLRTVWIKEKNGALHIVPNSSITTVSNFSRNSN